MFCLRNILRPFPVPLQTSIRAGRILSENVEKFQAGRFLLLFLLVLFQSETFYFVYRKKKYPVEMKSLRVEENFSGVLVQKKEEIRGNQTNFKPLTLGLSVPSSSSADTSVASISALMIPRALRIQLCCRLICLCSSFH